MFVDEIFSLMRKGRELTKDFDEISKANTKSLSKRASDSTCQFPCIIADSIPLAMAAAVTKNMDRVYASFVQTVIASDPLIDITIDRGPLDYMKRLHQNLKLESVIDEEALYESKRKQEEIKSFMESECSNLMVPDDLYGSVMEKAYNGEYKLYLDKTGSYGVAIKESVLSSDAMKSHLKQLESHLNSFDTRPFAVTEADTTKSDLIRGMLDQPNLSKMDIDIKASKELSTPKLLDRDIKRYNELQPYGISVRLMAVNDKKEFVQYMDFVVGIKAIMHPVKSAELVNSVGDVLKNRNAVFNFIRWTTGEISLVKDLILHIDELKTDASYKANGKNPFIPSLKRLKEKKVKFSSSGITKLVPNATLVLSSFEVEDLKNQFGVDVRDTYFAKKVIKDLFLLAFVVVDEGSETIDILYESSDAFETYTLETLEREVSLSSNKLGKEIGRMISQ